MMNLNFFFLGLIFIIFYFDMFFQFLFQMLMFFYFFLFLFNSLNNLNFWMKIYNFMGMDYYSYGMILLSLWVYCLMLMVSEKNLLKLNNKYYMLILIMMIFFLLNCFLMMNLLLFYLFFESSLLMIFVLIMGWGFQVDRVQASLYLMLYTLFGSLPLLFFILLIYLISFSLTFNFIMNFNMNYFIIYLLIIITFLVKMPMYFVHMWLPKAHVEAPLVGSMVLAGVMLKLGSYGLLRFMLFMMKMCMNFNKYMVILSLLGGVFSSLVCLYQIDMKLLVAYSSVVHMGLLMSGMLTLNNWGFFGGFLMMIAHGICSSGMFCLVNINYIRFNSRSMIINKGMINLFPSLTLMWFMLCSSNLSFPPSLNLFSEIMLLNSLVIWSLFLVIILMIFMFFSSLYSLYFYTFCQHGILYFMIYEIKNIFVQEYMLLLFHWIPLNLIFLYIYFFM